MMTTVMLCVTVRSSIFMHYLISSVILQNLENVVSSRILVIALIILVGMLLTILGMNAITKVLM